jgi:hypothetical protein
MIVYDAHWCCWLGCRLFPLKVPFLHALTSWNVTSGYPMFMDAVWDVCGCSQPCNCKAWASEALGLSPSSFLLTREIWPHGLLFRLWFLVIIEAWTQYLWLRFSHEDYEMKQAAQCGHCECSVDHPQKLRGKPSSKGDPEHTVFKAKLMPVLLVHEANSEPTTPVCCSSGNCPWCYRKSFSSLIQAFPSIKWAQSELLLCRSWWHWLASQAKEMTIQPLISAHLLKKS